MPSAQAQNETTKLRVDIAREKPTQTTHSNNLILLPGKLLGSQQKSPQKGSFDTQRQQGRKKDRVR